ncbi:MAG: hypothetical protein [Microviridae sp.]|nr:MAG: hypothetical protein [Microviridae sp.]
MKNTSEEKPRFKYRGYYHFKATVGDLEKGYPHSDTIQDDSYTIKEILEKFTRTGETLDERNATYQGEENEVSHESQDLRQVMAMDLVDRDELMSDVQERQIRASQRLKQIRDQEGAKKEAEEIAQRKAEQKKATDQGSEAIKGGSRKYKAESPGEADEN